MNNIDEAKRVIDIEINALIELKDSIGQDFEEILYLITNCKGKVILCGMGKSGHVAKKISATLASLGTPSFFLHPAKRLVAISVMHKTILNLFFMMFLHFYLKIFKHSKISRCFPSITAASCSSMWS